MFISGDAGGSEIGQSGLRVSGTLSLDNDAVLAVYGGKGTVVDTKGGTAIELNNGTITGGGKVIALGGEVLWKDGGTAVSGIGTIATADAYLQGATAYTHSPSKAQPGKAHDDTVTVTANRRHVADGELIGTVDDPLAGLYWKTGIDAAPNLTKFKTKAAETPVTPEINGSGSSSSGSSGSSSGSSSFSGSKHKTSKSNTTAASRAFEDVSADAYYNDAVEWAVKSGITNGKAEGLFGSNDPCTRGQIVTFLWRAAGSPSPKSTAKAPADVLPGSYCYDAVVWALENGIANGLPDGSFGADITCTRAQSVTFLFRVIGKSVDSKAEFSDVLPGSYYANAVAWAVENGVTNGIGDGLFGSDNDCTRAQIVTFLWRCMK